MGFCLNQATNTEKKACHRSALSAFHYKLDCLQIGEHPHVSSLVAGVFNKRLTQPKYSFIWYIQTALGYIKGNMAENLS